MRKIPKPSQEKGLVQLKEQRLLFSDFFLKTMKDRRQRYNIFKMPKE